MPLGLRKQKDWTANDMDALESRVVELEDAFNELEGSLGRSSGSNESNPDDSELRRLLVPLLTQALAARPSIAVPVVREKPVVQEKTEEVTEDEE